MVIEVVDRPKLQKTNGQLSLTSFLIWINRNMKHAMPRRYDRLDTISAAAVYHDGGYRPKSSDRRDCLVGTHAGCGCGERPGGKRPKQKARPKEIPDSPVRTHVPCPRNRQRGPYTCMPLWVSSRFAMSETGSQIRSEFD